MASKWYKPWTWGKKDPPKGQQVPKDYEAKWSQKPGAPDRTGSLPGSAAMGGSTYDPRTGKWHSAQEIYERTYGPMPGYGGGGGGGYSYRPAGPNLAKIKGEAAELAKKQVEAQEKALQGQLKNIDIMTAQALGMAETGAVGAGLGLDEAQRKFGVSGGLAMAEQSNLQAQVAQELGHIYGQKAMATTDVQAQIDMLEAQEDIWALDFYNQLLGLEGQSASIRNQAMAAAQAQAQLDAQALENQMRQQNIDFMKNIFTTGGYNEMEKMLQMQAAMGQGGIRGGSGGGYNPWGYSGYNPWG